MRAAPLEHRSTAGNPISSEGANSHYARIISLRHGADDALRIIEKPERIDIVVSFDCDLSGLISQNLNKSDLVPRSLSRRSVGDSLFDVTNLTDQELFRPFHFCSRPNDELRVLSNESASSSSQMPSYGRS